MMSSHENVPIYQIGIAGRRVKVSNQVLTFASTITNQLRSDPQGLFVFVVVSSQVRMSENKQKRQKQSFIVYLHTDLRFHCQHTLIL